MRLLTQAHPVYLVAVAVSVRQPSSKSIQDGADVTSNRQADWVLPVCLEFLARLKAGRSPHSRRVVFVTGCLPQMLPGRIAAMAGRIVDDDLALVRERSRIEDVIGGYLTLRRSGSDMTGLCPFHDEKTASFHVSPARGLFYCFGCGAGGDVIKFLQQIDNLTFVEAVQVLADRAGIQLRFDDAGQNAEPGLRQRILAANQAAAAFYGRQLMSPEGVTARQMLDSRGFDQGVAAQFGVGYAPKSGKTLHEHLHGLGFSDEELTKANLIRASGGWDVFQGRLMWPIRDSASVVLGFGARRLFDDDAMPAKYINTAETLVYKKSRVLYGLDLARTAIGKSGQAVVMEGYTDVMAAHLSGVNTAVASCGTAFGEDHARLLQRLIGVPAQGEVVFTFDGDAAGQKAALKVFDLADRFLVPTSVAVAPDGLDPCDLRLQRGDSALGALVDAAEPLYMFVMRHQLAGFDLDRADSRVDAVRAVAPILATVKDTAKRTAFIDEVGRIVGMDETQVRQIVRQRGASTRQRRPKAEVAAAKTPPAEDATRSLDPPYPPAGELALSAERGACQLMLQAPAFFTTDWCQLRPDDFRHPAYRAICEAVLATPFDESDWAGQVAAATPSPVVQRLETELLLAPLLKPPDDAYVSAYAARVRLWRLTAQLDTLRSRLQRMNPVTQSAEQVPLFRQVVDLEAQKAQLTREALGI